MSERARDLWCLFREMFFIAAFVLGGGYVILSAADERLPKKLNGIRSGELFEMLPLFQMVPGIIAGHTAVYVGNKVAGIPGAVVALSGIVLPSVIVFTAITLVYRSIPVESPLMVAAFLGLRASLVGVMAEMIVRTWKKSIASVVGLVAVCAAVLLMQLAHVSPGMVIVAGMVIGVLVTWLKDRCSSMRDGKVVFRSFWLVPLLFMKYGLLAFGGGFVLVPVFLHDFVGSAAPCLQLEPPDFANVIALTQMSPGPLAANCATFFGHGLGGLAGAIVATVCLVLPGSVILLLALRSIERFRASFVMRGVFAGMRPVTVALLVSATWSIAGMSLWQTGSAGIAVSPLAVILAALSAAAVWFRWIGAVYVILLSSLFSVACAVVRQSMV